MPYLIAIFGLFAIILIHEAGHFLAARMVGVRATRFFIFFPPKLVSVQRGEVEYGIGTIPLGGFVKLPGMFEPRAEESHWRIEPEVRWCADQVAEGAARTQLLDLLDAVKRSADADQLGRACTELADGVLAHATNRRMRVIARRIRDIADDCHERAYWRAQLWRRMVVILAGPLANIILAFVIFWTVATFLNPVYHYSWKIGKVSPGAPAAVAGVKQGDLIVSWNGVKPGSSARQASRFAKTVTKSIGKPTVISVRDSRAGAGARTYRLTPTDINGKQRIGVMTQVEQAFVRYERDDPWSALHTGARAMVTTSSAVVTGLSRLTNPDNLDEVSSVVGIVKVAPAWAEAGNLVGYLGILSLAIAIYNLLPLLPMDGGHVAFGVIERIRRGRPLPRAAFERYSMVGLMLMLGLFAVGLSNDLGLRG